MVEVVWISDNDDSDASEWDMDGEAETSSAAAWRNLDAPGPSTLDANGCLNGKASSDFVEKFVGMGFPEERVLKGIKEIGHSDGNGLLNYLLKDDLVGSSSTSGCALLSVQDDSDDDLDFDWGTNEDAGGREPNSDSSGVADFLQEITEKDEKIKSLQEMGFTGEQTDMAISICGVDAPLDVLVDSISASQHEASRRCFDYFGARKRAKFPQSVCVPKQMIGFSLPTDRHRLPPVNRMLPEEVMGRPYFYFENVARAPADTWSDISRTLYQIEPEFVDSIHICATARKRGYVHNLPIENRYLRPLPPSSIFDAFPEFKQWWPQWDTRRKLNCLQTVAAPSTVTERIQRVLSTSSRPPVASVQEEVNRQCSKWNLVWTGKNKATPLEPQEMEQLLGFPRDHTRAATRTERYKSLGNTFQVDTVAYHLSVLKRIFPNGMTVLSLFTGIGGAEVALHRLGIRMKAVVSVEISEVNRGIFKSWFDQNEPHGELIEFEDVENLSKETIETLTRRLGGFDLVIGGSPCNNLTGSNRHHRVGLQGKQSALFYQYFRILREVKSVMATM